MATYFMFGKYSMEAVKAISTKRTDDAVTLIKQNGGELKAGYALLGGGVFLALLSLLLDPVRGKDYYLNTVQILVLIVGVVAAAVGAYLTYMRKPPAA